MKFAHPWRDILVGENASEDAKAPEDVDQVHNDTSVNMTESEDIEISLESQDLDQDHNTLSTDSLRYKNFVIFTFVFFDLFKILSSHPSFQSITMEYFSN